MRWIGLKNGLRTPSVAWCFIVLIAACDLSPPAAAQAEPVNGASIIDATTNFDEIRPFSTRDRAQDPRLRSLIQTVAAGAGRCLESAVILTAGSDFEVCDSDQIVAMRSLLGIMAPALDPERMDRFIVAELNGDDERELIVTYRIDHCTDWMRSDRAPCRYHDRYMAAFLFRWLGDRYRVAHAGNFLEGALHAIAAFGPEARERSLFFRQQSCTECEPWVFLFVVDFSADPDGTAFEFTYAVDHQTWDMDIEYRLPGMGHSIEATVDTRITARGGPDGPHLMQLFDLAEGADEWWLFRCSDRRCDYEMFENALPAEYVAMWEKALRL